MEVIHKERLSDTATGSLSAESADRDDIRRLMQHQLEKFLLQPLKPSSTLEIFVAPEEMVEKSNLGQLFILVDIHSREKDLKEKIKQLIDLVSKDYYSSPVLDIESSLESTCQNLNLNLNEIFSKPELWYKKANVLIAVTRDDILTFSHIGQFSGYLVRDKKISQILDSTGQNEEPAFSQLTTGEVKTNDVLVIANYALFDFFSLEKIKEVVSKLNPGQAVEQFKNLMSENVKTPNLLAVIMKYNQSPVEADDQLDKTKKYLQELYGSQESMQQLENLEQRTGRTLTASVWPSLDKVKKAFEFKSNKQKDKKTLKLPKDEKKAKPSLDSTESKGVDKNKFLIPLQKVKDIMPKSGGLAVQEAAATSKSKTILIVIIVLIVVFGSSLGYMQYKKQGEQREQIHQDVLSQIEDKMSQAEAAMIYQDDEGANELLSQALIILNNQTTSNEKWQAEYDNQKMGILKLVNEINHIYDVVPELVVNLARVGQADIKQIIKEGDGLYVFINGNQIYSVIPAKKSLSLFMEQEGLKDIVLWEEKGLLFLSDENKFSLRTKNEEEVINVLLETDQDVDEMAVYGDRIYFLDKDLLMIYKISKPLTTSPEVSEWYKDDQELVSGAQEMMIDGDIWLVNQNQILRLLRGEQEDFELAKLDKNLGKDLELYTELEWDFLYVLDKQNGRLVVIDKGGIVEKQFLSDKLKQAEHLVINNNQTLAWYNIGGEIYEIEMR